MADWESYLEARERVSQDELLELLSIPSISSLPEYAGDVQQAAEWAAARLRQAGIENVDIMPTDRHPVVYGDWLHAPGKPTILIYGHFDVQPVDPIELWQSPPFQPEVRDGRVYARGASDMKGSLLITILAVESLLQADGRLPVNVKFLFEGEEEIGSPDIPPFLAANREKFAADLAVSADGGQAAEDQPVLLVALKGLAGIQIDVRGPGMDLHSGMFGGAVANPIHALVHILDTMHTPDGAIAVDGFYDDVVPLTDEERGEMAQVPFDEDQYRAGIGVSALFGEPGYTPMERAWARPTLEINGIYGGFQGDGVKTVLPSEAHAKITCRLVRDQRPERIEELLLQHVRTHTPPGVEVNAVPIASRAIPYYISPDHWGNQAIGAVLREVYGRDPWLVRLGGSVPVCETFLTTLGAYTVGLGFGMQDERAHSPNEFLRLSNFKRGQRVWARALVALAEAHPK